MKLSLAFHVISLVLWLGGLMILTRFMKLLASEVANPALASLVKRSFYGYVVPGFLIASITGIYQLSVAGISFYMKQGWFHAKLTLVLILVVATFLVAGEVKKATLGQRLSAAKLAALHGISALILLLVVGITLLFR